jgi:hypothetical protein
LQDFILIHFLLLNPEEMRICDKIESSIGYGTNLYSSGAVRPAAARKNAGSAAEIALHQGRYLCIFTILWQGKAKNIQGAALPGAEPAYTEYTPLERDLLASIHTQERG